MERELDVEGGTLPFATFHPDAPTMALKQFPGQVEPDAQATNRTIEVTGAVEALEDAWQFAGSDADALVFHPDQCLAWFVGSLNERTQAELDPAASGTVLDGIAEQVGQHLLDAFPVNPADQRTAGLQPIQHKLEVMLLGSGGLAFQGVLEGGNQIVGSQVESELDVLNASDIEQVFDEVGEMLALLGDATEGTQAARVVQVLLARGEQLEDLGKALYGSDGGAQFVADDGEKLLFLLLQALACRDILKDDDSSRNEAILVAKRSSGGKGNNFAATRSYHHRFQTIHSLSTERLDNGKIPGEHRRLVRIRYQGSLLVLVERNIDQAGERNTQDARSSKVCIADTTIRGFDQHNTFRQLVEYGTQASVLVF